MSSRLSLFLRAAAVAAAILPAAHAADDPGLMQATALERRAVELKNTGHFPEAASAEEKALALREKALGPDHPDVATSLNYLALIYDSEGRYDEAEQLHKRALAIREKSAGADDEDLATSLNNLAELYYGRGRYAEAEAMFKRSLAVTEKLNGPDHILLATTVNNLGMLYENRGRYAEAEAMFKRSLPIYEKELGPDSTQLALNLNNLGTLYYTQGRYDDAEPFYRRSLATLEKALGPDHPQVAVVAGNLAALLEARGHYAEAEPLYKRALAIDRAALGPDHASVAQMLNNLGMLYYGEGRYADAEAFDKQSLSIWEKALGPEHPNIAVVLSNLALLYIDEGRYAEAEPLYKRALALSEAALGPDHPSVGLILNNLALVYMAEQHYADAEPLYQRCLRIDEAALGPDHPTVARALSNLGALYIHEGRYADAEPLYRRSLAIARKVFGPEHRSVANDLNNLAELFKDEGRYAEAEPLLRQSLDIYQATLGPEHPAIATTLTNLAGLAKAQGRIAEALDDSRRSIAIFASRFADLKLDPADATAAERRDKRTFFLQNIALVHDAGEPDAAAESFRVAQLAGASSAAQALAGMSARFAAGSDALAGVVRARQDLATRQQALDAAILAAAGKPPAQRDPATEAKLRRELDDTGNRLDALDTAIARDFPRYAELSNPKPVELSDAQALVADDEAMLVYLVGDDESWLWVVRRDRAGFLRLDITARRLSAEVARLRERLDPSSNRDWTPFDAKRAHALYQTILAPAASFLAGAHHLLVVPDGALESLPFAVLVTAEPAIDPETPADHRAVAWLARDYAVSVLPSVGALQALRKFTAAGQAALPFVGIGDPLLQGAPEPGRAIQLASLFRGGRLDAAAVRALPGLPETAVELRMVAKALGAADRDLYLGERASEPVLRQADLARYRVVEFATHGLMSGDIKGLTEPALVLTPPEQPTPDDDGLLTASKVATLKLDADWVVLSACNTAAADGTPEAGGLSGLAKAFFYAGARSLLVSHWSVPSAATVKLVVGAFEQLQQHPSIGRAEALRRAEMAMLDPANPPEYAHPLVWAPFVLAGEGGAGR